MRHALAVGCLATPLLAAVCTAAAASPAPPRGAVAGRLIVEGGPLGAGGQQPPARPIPGTVRFTSSQHHQVTVSVDDSGRFFVHLPAGRYKVCDRSPRLLEVGSDGVARQTWSSPVLVTVTWGHTVKITLVTAVP